MNKTAYIIHSDPADRAIIAHYLNNNPNVTYWRYSGDTKIAAVFQHESSVLYGGAIRDEIRNHGYEHYLLIEPVSDE